MILNFIHNIFICALFVSYLGFAIYLLLADFEEKKKAEPFKSAPLITKNQLYVLIGLSSVAFVTSGASTVKSAMDVMSSRRSY